MLATVNIGFEGLIVPACWFPLDSAGLKVEYLYLLHAFPCFHILFILPFVRIGVLYMPIGVIAIIGIPMLLGVVIRLIQVRKLFIFQRNY